MNPKLKLLILFFLVLFMISFLNLFQDTTSSTVVTSDSRIITKDLPFNINNNGDFVAYASTGDGSPGTPYIIENYFINLTSINDDGIEIINTDAYFILQNCTIINSPVNQYGIMLSNVRNGIIRNNTLKFDNQGIYISASRHNIFENNVAINSTNRGFSITGTSYNNTFIHNTAINTTNFGFFLATYCYNNSFIENTAIDTQGSGFYISSCNNNTYIKNTVVRNKNYGFFISSSNYSRFEGNNISIGNSWAISLTGSKNNTLENNFICNNKYYGILVSNALNNSFLHNTVDNNPMGIRLSQFSRSNIIAHNSFSNCDNNGIYFFGNSSNNLIDNNTVNNNDQGIYFLDACANNVITRNTANNNTYGIYLDDFPLDNEISYNTVYNSSIYGIFLKDGASGNQITHNYVYFSEDTGIYLENVENNDIKHNILGGNFKALDQTIPFGNSFFNNTIYRYIQILNDADFSKYASRGSGLFSDPYIIENQIINAETLGIHGISVVNTFSYFSILNCLVINGITGIYLKNVYLREIINCTVVNNEDGIYIEDTSNFNITGNTISQNAADGIYLYDQCDNNRLINNTVNENGDGGINLYMYCENNILTNNEANNNSRMGILTGYYSRFNILNNNTANGNSQFGFWISANNNTLINNTANYNGDLGYYVQYADSNTIFKCIANENQFYGIYLDHGDYNNVSWNILHYNLGGILEDPASVGNIIQNNDIINRPIDNPIEINQNADFEIYKSQGDGSINNPYVIEDKVIAPKWLKLHGILINNTNAYFIIRNCTFLETDTNYAGIILINCTKGVIQNNTFFTSSIGINIMDTNYMIVENNSFNQNGAEGLYLYNLNHSVIKNNFISESGYTTGYGICWLYGINNSILNNTFTDIHDLGLFLKYVNNSKVINNTIERTHTYGIELMYSHNNTLISNIVKNSGNDGFYIYLSGKNRLYNNTAMDTEDIGFFVYYQSTNNELSYNIAFNNSYYGIFLSYLSSYNTITWNILVENEVGAYYANPDCIGNTVANNVYTDDPPQWSNLNVNPSDTFEYVPNVPLQFTISWDDTHLWSSYFGITSVIFQFEGVNYTPTYLGGDDYSFDLIDLSAGNHYYQWFARDTMNQWSTTGYNWINISRADPQLRLFLNGTEGSYSAPYGSIINITTTFGTPAPLSPSIFNSSNFLTTSTTSFWNFTSCGLSQISAICTGNINYTGDIVLYFLNINDDRLPQISNIITNPVSGVMYVPGASYQFNATCIDFESGIERVILEMNGVNLTVLTHVGYEYYFTFNDLSAGNRPYRWFAKDKYDNWAVSSIHWFNITRRISSVRLFLNGTQADFTAPTGSTIKIDTAINHPREVSIFNESSFLTTDTTSYWTFTNIGIFTIDAVAFGDINYTTVSVSYNLNITDGYGPQILNIDTSPSSPATYEPGADYIFRANFLDESGVDTVILEFNTQNYTVLTHAGSLYFHTIPDLPVGSYPYRFFAQDIFNNWAVSSYNWFVIGKKIPQVQLFLNGTQSNFTASTWSVINITVIVEDSCPIAVFNESTYITGALSSTWNFTSIGLFMIRATAISNANYSAFSRIYYLNMTDGYQPQVDNILTDPPSPVIYKPREYYQFNATWTDDSPIETVLLEVNGVNFTVSQSIGVEYYYSFYDVPAADRQYRWFARDIFGNWGVSAFYWFNITRRTPILRLYLNDSQSDLVTNAGTIVNISYSITNSQPVLIYNESNYLTNDGKSYWHFPRVGIYQIQALYFGNVNYTPTSVSYYLNLTDGSPPSITNLGVSPYVSVEYSPGALYQFNATCQDESGIETVLLELGSVNHTVITHVGDEFYYNLQDLPAANYIVRWFAKDYYNKWAVKGHWLNVTRKSSTIQMYLNGTQGNISMPAKSIINITLTLDFSDPIAVFNESNLLTTSHMSGWKFKAVGFFRIMALSSGNQNYTPAMVIYYINVTDSYNPIASQLITYPSSPIIYISGANYQFNVTFLDHSGIDMVFLEFDGVNYTVTTHSGNEYFIIFNNLSIGTHLYRWICNDSYNNWLITDFYEFKITEEGAPFDTTTLLLIVALIGAVLTVALVIGVRRRSKTAPRPFNPPKSKPKVNICGVHKGLIKGLNYVCSNCGVSYCLDCAEQLSKQTAKGNCLYCNTPMNYYNIQYQVIEQSATELPPKGMAEIEKEMRKPPEKNYYHLKKEELIEAKDYEKGGLEKKEDISKKKGQKEAEENFYKKKSEEFSLKKNQKEV